MGVDIRFKISVFMGTTTPMRFLTPLAVCRSPGEDGSAPLAGFNLSNSIDDVHLREGCGNPQIPRPEDACGSNTILRRPERRSSANPTTADGLLELVKTVPNISANMREATRKTSSPLSHPSDILDYFPE